MLRVVIVMTALVAAAPRSAEASSCHGGSSGGSTSSSGGNSSSSSSSTSASSSACHDTTDIVGYRECTRFGAWSTGAMPALFVELGTMIARFPDQLGGAHGVVQHGGEGFTYRMVGTGGELGLETASLATMRIGVGLSHGLYVAADTNMGGVIAGPQAQVAMQVGAFGPPELVAHYAMVLDVRGVVGVHGRTGLGWLGIEVAGGARSVTYAFESRYHDCAQPLTISTVAPVVEARVHGEAWLSPWLTAGATVGASVIERGAWSSTVFLGVHLRAFGGDR